MTDAAFPPPPTPASTALDPTPEVLAPPVDTGLSGVIEPDGETPSEHAPGRYPLPRVIAIANQKGGVGKTTTTINVGASLAELGQRVLIVDLDPQANASTGLGIENRGLETSMYHVLMQEVPLENCIEPTDVKGLFVAPASLDLAGAEIELVPAFSRETRLRRSVEAVGEQFDYVLIDCPPSLGPAHGQRAERRAGGTRSDPVRVLRPGRPRAVAPQRRPRAPQPQPRPPRQHDRVRDV